MNPIDVNLLLYAYNYSSQHHNAARLWIERVFSSNEPAGLAWITVPAFLRIVTNSRALRKPLSLRHAAAVADQWLRVPAVRLFDPGPRHWTILSSLIRNGQVRGPLIADACLAAIAIEQGLVLCTNDRDFSRFDGPRVFSPLS